MNLKLYLVFALVAIRVIWLPLGHAEPGYQGWILKDSPQPPLEFSSAPPSTVTIMCAKGRRFSTWIPERWLLRTAPKQVKAYVEARVATGRTEYNGSSL